MALGCKQHLDVLRGGIEDRGEVIRRHLDNVDTQGFRDIKRRQEESLS